MHHAHDCQCGQEHHQGHHDRHHGDMRPQCGCGCHGGGAMPRRFFTREERIRHLEEYLRALEAEAEGVREHLAELRNEG